MSAESAPGGSNAKSETLYGALGVQPDASAEDIKNAFREKAKEYHPDSAEDGKGNPEAFSKLTEAYAELRDTAKRSAYDQRLRDGASRAQASGGQQQSYRYSGGGYSGSSRERTDQREGAERTYRYGDFGRQWEQAQQEQSSERPHPSEFTGMKRKLYEALLDLEREMKERHQREQAPNPRPARPTYERPRPRPQPTQPEEKRSEAPPEFVVIEAYGRKYLADSAGRNQSGAFESIEKRDGAWIGRVYDRDTLLDPMTARSLSRAYENISKRDGMWIGRIYGNEHLIDIKTGREISPGFDSIERRGAAIIGKKYGHEKIIPQPL